MPASATDLARYFSDADDKVRDIANPSRGTLGVEGDARGERRLIVASSGSLNHLRYLAKIDLTL